MIIKNHFHKKGFALGLVLKQRLVASRKWPIQFFILYSRLLFKLLDSASLKAQGSLVALYSGN